MSKPRGDGRETNTNQKPKQIDHNLSSNPARGGGGEDRRRKTRVAGENTPSLVCNVDRRVQHQDSDERDKNKRQQRGV